MGSFIGLDKLVSPLHHALMRSFLVIMAALLLGAAIPTTATALSATDSDVPAAASVSCALTLQYPHISSGSPGKVDAKGTFTGSSDLRWAPTSGVKSPFTCTSSVNAVIYTKLTYKKNGTTTTAATSTETRAASTTAKTYYVPRSGVTPPACVAGAVYTAYASISYGGVLDEATVTNPSSLC